MDEHAEFGLPEPLRSLRFGFHVQALRLADDGNSK
jgi:hypothetical protein